MKPMGFKYMTPRFSDLSAMRSLWKITFGDTDGYLDILFDNYINPQDCIVVYDGDELISMLVGIPYKFMLGSKDIDGLYLCGLATKPEYRGGGLMTSLLNRASEICREFNYEFTFLIPADMHLREYYQRNGFLNTSPIHRFSLIGETRDLEGLMKQLKSLDNAALCWSNHFILTIHMEDGVLKGASEKLYDKFDDIIISIKDAYSCDPGIHLEHSVLDWKWILMEKLMSGGALVSTINNDVIFNITPDYRVEIFKGNMSDAIEIINDIYDPEKNVFQALEEIVLYGMMRGENDFLAKFISNFKGSENRIFEKEWSVIKKYGKMKFDELANDLRRKIASRISFQYMLD